MSHRGRNNARRTVKIIKKRKRYRTTCSIIRRAQHPTGVDIHTYTLVHLHLHLHLPTIYEHTVTLLSTIESELYFR